MHDYLKVNLTVLNSSQHSHIKKQIHVALWGEYTSLNSM